MRYLQTAMRGVLTREEMNILPTGFDRLGHVVILWLPPKLIPRVQEITQALLRIKGVRTVALKVGTVKGRFREPQVKVVAGDPITETVHKENGCVFKLDAARVMFSLGNVFERARVAGLVRRGEVVVDLFAGVGQFSMPIAKQARPSRVYAIEINPVAHQYLQENVRLNYVGHLVWPILGDCAEVAPRGVADRVVMGMLHVTHEYLLVAMQVLKPSGGVIHYHESVPSKIRFERSVKRIFEAADGREVEILGKRFVKRYAPGVDHVVIDAKIGPFINGREQ